MTVASKLQNFRQRKRAWGLKRALYWELMHLLAKYLGFRIHRVVVGSDLKRPVEAVPPDVPEGYETRIVGLNDLLPFSSRVPELSADFLREAFARGDECAANFNRGELVGFGFVSRSRAPVSDQLEVLIPVGFRYNYKDWTHSDHRQRNLSKIRGHVRFTTMPRPYVERSISYVETHNYASLLHGYRHPRERNLAMGLCGWITLLGRQITFNSRRARWVGFELVRKGDDGRRQYVR
jgi:hypothetical protein